MDTHVVFEQIVRSSNGVQKSAPRGFDWDRWHCAAADVHDPPLSFAEETSVWLIPGTDVVFCEQCKSRVGEVVDALAHEPSLECSDEAAMTVDSLVRASAPTALKSFGGTQTWVDAHEATQKIKDVISGPLTVERAHYEDYGEHSMMLATYKPFIVPEAHHMYAEARTLELIAESALDVPRPDRIADLELPENGFVLFGAPLPDGVAEQGCRAGHVTAISWRNVPISMGGQDPEKILLATLWTTPDLAHPTVGTGIPTNDGLHVQMNALGRGPSTLPKLLPLSMSFMLDKDSPFQRAVSSVPEDEIPDDWNEPYYQWFRFLVAFGAWVQSTITPEDMDNPRHIRRQYTRKDQTPPTIRMIKLRGIEKLDEHRKPAEPGNRDSKFDHRWVVSGHWRQQACGPNRSRRRPVYIAPYVKGPEDGELRHTQRIFKVDR